MGSILIRRIPDPIHKDFKALCQVKQTSMEKEIIRLIVREITRASRRKANAATQAGAGRGPAAKVALP